jgi:hypothetical protein
MEQVSKRGSSASILTKGGPGRKDRGAALLLVIVLSTIALLIMTTVLYMVMMGTGLSGSEKRYRTAHEAALGGVDIVKALIQSQAAVPVPNVAMSFTPDGTYAAKLAASDLSSFPAEETMVTINTNSSLTYDFTIDLGNPPYRVYAKMISKTQGNTQLGYKQVRVKTGVVPANPGMGQVHYTYYTFEILAQKLSNPDERARMELVQIF